MPTSVCKSTFIGAFELACWVREANSSQIFVDTVQSLDYGVTNTLAHFKDALQQAGQGETLPAGVLPFHGQMPEEYLNRAVAGIQRYQDNIVERVKNRRAMTGHLPVGERGAWVVQRIREEQDNLAHWLMDIAMDSYGECLLNVRGGAPGVYRPRPPRLEKRDSLIPKGGFKINGGRRF